MPTKGLTIPKALEIPEQYKHIFQMESFEGWLQGFEFNAYIGTPNDPCGCPFANYLYSKIEGFEEYQLGVLGGEFRIKDTYYIMPKWAHEFVQIVDCIDRDVKITASRCLNILREIKGG